MGGNTPISQPHQTDRIYNPKDELKLYNFHLFLLFLDDLEHIPNRTILDCSFQPITISSMFAFIDRFKILKNVFYVFVLFFRTMAVFGNS